MPQFLYDKSIQEIREQYQKIIKLKEFGLKTCLPSSCENEKENILGYSNYDFQKAPKEADLALGCANPKAYAHYQEGQIVLDLGCGAGFDCFLASHEVGAKGKVIGVDMMHEMISKAREIAYKYKYSNVEFRLGEIEHLPVENNSIDIVISNCVLNLSPNKEQVIKECKRVMKTSAKFIIFDILLDDEFSLSLKQKLQTIPQASCIKSAITVSEMKSLLEKEKFQNIFIKTVPKSKEIIHSWLKEASFAFNDNIYSAMICANLM